VATTAAALSRRGYRVTVLTYDDTRSDFFSLPPEVERIPLGLTRARPTPIPRLIPRMFRTLSTLRAGVLASAPHVVITHMTRANVQTLLALAGSRIPIIVTEHGDVATAEFRKAAWYRLRHTCYRSAFRVVSVSDAVDRNVCWVPEARRTVIPNPIAVGSRTAETGSRVRDCIVSVGRLSHAKGFDILISAFARLAADFPEWRLVIVGGGELREELERQAQALRLGDRVVFTGALADPTVLLRKAKLFVMGSRYEGFPLAHGEALACGLPVVATDCPSRPLAKGERFVPGGVRELVHHDVNGLLVQPEDPDALARGMAALMSDPRRREALAGRGREVLARLSPEKITDAWEKLIDQAISRPKDAHRPARSVTPERTGAGPRRSTSRAS
jgi:GalNAc-alpha-(1->4)-GalNAc-alpha-(1->3)-diNAcBac-PP-undecaprenol alpha-1,4-N-acetyl-D-galactosaminyltransferase